SIQPRSGPSARTVPADASSAASTSPRRAPRAASTSFRLIRNRVLELADAVDLDLDRVAGPHPQRRLAAGADPARRAGRDHVARLERGERRAVGDQRRDVEVELPDALA